MGVVALYYISHSFCHRNSSTSKDCLLWLLSLRCSKIYTCIHTGTGYWFCNVGSVYFFFFELWNTSCFSCSNTLFPKLFAIHIHWLFFTIEILLLRVHRCVILMCSMQVHVFFFFFFFSFHILNSPFYVSYICVCVVYYLLKWLYADVSHVCTRPFTISDITHISPSSKLQRENKIEKMREKSLSNIIPFFTFGLSKCLV